VRDTHLALPVQETLASVPWALEMMQVTCAHSNAARSLKTTEMLLAKEAPTTSNVPCR
jgi:hypothetical protein